MKKAKSGDIEAFSKLTKGIYMTLYKIAISKLDKEDDAYDAIQETLVIVYTKIKKLKNNKNFKRWIIKILINKCNDIYRMKYKNRNISIESEQLKNTLIINDDINLNSNLNFYKIIEFLDYEERLILILFYSENYTSKEIAKLLKKNENTIRTKISRAKKKILQNYNMEEEFYG